ncbi:hypothetical protein Bbelb_330980 [Branchiostoma belcheri]|nr:hypothetical protein Bbelb_330980 [Branchiostoma belcheri]
MIDGECYRGLRSEGECSAGMLMELQTDTPSQKIDSPREPIVTEKETACDSSAMRSPEHPLHDLVPAQRQSATGRTLRNCHNITVPYARTKRLQQSFLYCAIRLYNNSPSI